ncbi:RNase adapter RapZ [Streptomyces chumphonensis]|uniref:ATPase n=1 Tax=Streptomyces chumphonensis TaxID=1214925 RepID=A0A927IAQ1_9ACTN|nr:RNase adapter RapZ [Streptomyces chumphonensis]MBD3931948.1 ATPase [Streptomyces chumphonensis]
MSVTITSFGYLHAPPPAAHLTVDLRNHFRDPHVSPALRYLTAEDQEVRETVLRTPGIVPLLDALAGAVRAYQAGPTPGPVTVAVGCAGGRHRAPTVASELGYRLAEHAGPPVTVHHRDLPKPVVTR